jgi:hypothetical protein
LHYTLRLREGSVATEWRPWFELQVRTLAEDTWAEIEHVLGYKLDKRTGLAVSKQFEIISAHLNAIDEHFNFLRAEQERFQNESAFDETDPLNAENVVRVLSASDIRPAQVELNYMLKALVSQNVSTIGQLRSVATSANVKLIAEKYQEIKKQKPSNQEAVAHLAYLAVAKAGEDPATIVQRNIRLVDGLGLGQASLDLD